MMMRRPRRLAGTRPTLSARLITHLTALAGCTAILQPSAASARSGRPVPPAGAALEAEPPWSGSEGFPPPRPLARTRAATPAPHPALHPGSEPVRPPLPLFPRATDLLERRAEREAAMKRHPAGKGVGPAEASTRVAMPAASHGNRSRSIPEPRTGVSGAAPICSKKHRVEPGETLWGIASRRSASDRPIDILRLSMEIYRLNKEVIGSDPDLILPGQLLSLPQRCTR